MSTLLERLNNELVRLETGVFPNDVESLVELLRDCIATQNATTQTVGHMKIDRQVRILIAKMPVLTNEIQKLLGKLGKSGECSSCGADIYFIRVSMDGRRIYPPHIEAGDIETNPLRLIPYTIVGTNHFLDCPGRDNHKKTR